METALDIGDVETYLKSFDTKTVKVQREALAESSVVVGRVFGNKMGRRLTVVEESLFSGIATSTVQVSYTRYTFTCSQ